MVHLAINRSSQAFCLLEIASSSDMALTWPTSARPPIPAQGPPQAASGLAALVASLTSRSSPAQPANSVPGMPSMSTFSPSAMPGMPTSAPSDDSSALVAALLAVAKSGGGGGAAAKKRAQTQFLAGAKFAWASVDYILIYVCDVQRGRTDVFTGGRLFAILT
jgi:hypothetical protein